MRYVIAGTRRRTTAETGLFIAGATVYVSNKGVLTYGADRAAVVRSLPEARKELDYWSTTHTKFEWEILHLPRGPVASAVLRAQAVPPN